jgi:hypothetical protein
MRFVSVAAIGVLTAAAPILSGVQRTRLAGDVQAPQPAGTMQSLINAFSGRWSLKLKFEPSRNAPDGLEGTGEEAWHAGPEQLTLTDEEVLHAGPQSIIVVGILWQDRKTRDFHAMDCSNQNPHTCDPQGAVGVVVHWTGSELSIDEEEPSPEGKMMISRVVWSDVTSNTFTETGYLGAPGGPFRKVMTVHATRVRGR